MVVKCRHRMNCGQRNKCLWDDRGWWIWSGVVGRGKYYSRGINQNYCEIREWGRRILLQELKTVNWSTTTTWRTRRGFSLPRIQDKKQNLFSFIPWSSLRFSVSPGDPLIRLFSTNPHLFHFLRWSLLLFLCSQIILLLSSINVSNSASWEPISSPYPLRSPHHLEISNH